MIETAASNNGMHPTRDTLPVKFNQWRGAAGDAGRYTASDKKSKDVTCVAVVEVARVE